MGPVRTRASFAALCLAVVVALTGVVTAQQRRGSADIAVGTSGPALDGGPAGRSPARLRPASGIEGDDATSTTTGAASPVTSTARRGSRGTTTTATPASAPDDASTSEADDRGPGPATLLGRVVYMEEDSAVAHSLRSARLDGSDERREVTCPEPTVAPPPPEQRQADYWIPTTTFDISPDGTHVVRSCLLEAPVATGRWDIPNGRWALVVQDVDGVGSVELLRYDLTRHHVYPSFAPDGRRILVWTQEALLLINADGTGRRVLQANPSPDAQRFTWSPDGTKVTTDSLAILDIATGRWSHPMEDFGQPWPYRGGYAAIGVVAWKADGIWWVSEFATATGPPHGTEVWGLYHLDPTTGIARHVQRWDTLVYAGELVGSDIYGASRDGDDSFVRVDAAGVAHVIPGVTTYGGTHIPLG